MRKILFIFGTRPEAIKLAPLIKEFQNCSLYFDVKICITGQHREMLDQVLHFFEITPDYDLNLMRPNQNLSELTASILVGLRKILSECPPNLVIVHGDTTTTFAASLASFYHQIPVAHIEAGLRTNNIYSPFPEEINRQLTSKIAKYHFTPTLTTKANLLKEGVSEKSIFVTGNTVIDALFMAISKTKTAHIEVKEYHVTDREFILVTGHRRENFGEGFLNICEALKAIALTRPEIDIVYPVHFNPNVREPVNKILKDISNIYLIEPLEYKNFVYLMSRSYIILTDSGGIQEEAPSIGIPVLVMRNTTERQEVVESGSVKLVGTKKDNIVLEVLLLIDNQDEYNNMKQSINPYGDGKASEHITTILLKELSCG
jgi:UDP-N-acetylglucosamine 2-epimerase (non-hydrolysing)